MSNVVRHPSLLGSDRRKIRNLVEAPSGTGSAISRRLSIGGRQQRADKLVPPYYDFRLVSTDKGRQYIDTARAPKLITVSAPTGYGKTAFLTQLYRNWSDRGNNCVWVSLDKGDQDISRILSLLEQAASGRSGQLGDDDLADPAQSLDTRVERVIRRLAALGSPILFIDNLHWGLDEDLSVLLDTLVFTTGAQLRLVLASRTEITFEKGRARLELGAIQIGVKELSFDAGSVTNVLREAGLVDVPPEIIDLIVEKTEGWPAAVRLIQALMIEEADPIRALKRFSGSDTDLAAMLDTRLLSGFDSEMVDFLLSLSALRAISAELAVAVSGNANARNLIKYLVNRNALIVGLDRDGIWFRLHNLFRDFLTVQAQRRFSADEQSGFLERAAKWCHEHDHAEDAARYALAAPAPALIRAIMDANARQIVSDRGDLATYLAWVDQAGRLSIEIGPESEFWCAWALTFSRRTARARERAVSLERRLAGMPADAPGVVELTRRLPLLRVMFCVVDDDVVEAKRGALEWLQAEQTRTPIYTMTAALAAATSMLPLQEYAEAGRYIHLAQGAMGHIDGGHSRAWMAAAKALLQLDLGNPACAEHGLVPAHTRAVEMMGPNARMAAILATLRARALCDLGRSDEARILLASSIGRSSNQGFVDTTRHGLEAAVALGDGEETGPLGFATLEAIASDGPRRLNRILAAAQIRRLSLLGEHARALEIAKQSGLDSRTGLESDLPGEKLSVDLARIDLLIVHGPIKSAQKLAELTLRQATLLDCRREMVELHLLLARLHLNDNDTTRAVRSISRAIVLAAPRNLIQPFLQQQKIFKEVLQNARLKDLALTLNEQINFFRTISGMTGALVGHASSSTGMHSGEVGTLTHREVEMLMLLESGPSNQQIADQLLVSTQTVKWHLYNLYAKLGVRNRAAALAKARSLRIISH